MDLGALDDVLRKNPGEKGDEGGSTGRGRSGARMWPGPTGRSGA